SLNEIGIVEISLSLTPTGFTTESTLDSAIVNTATFVWADGHTGTMHDLMLATQYAHIRGWNPGTGNETLSPLSGDTEFGRAVGGTGSGRGGPWGRWVRRRQTRPSFLCAQTPGTAGRRCRQSSRSLNP